jgi:DNA polymerase III subunit epsilon
MNLSARREAIQKAQELLARKPIYLDTETTGTGPNDNILEISIIEHDGSVLIDTLIKPVGKIDPGAQRVHGISVDMVANAPRWGDEWAKIEAILEGRILGIYNADFDLRMMQQSHTRNWLQWRQPEGLEIFCIMKLYAQFWGQWNSRRGNYRWQSLDNAGQQCDIALPNSHRAKDDTLLTRAILEYMANSA